MGERILRILVADDHRIMREGLRSLLEREPFMKIVGEAENGKTVVRLAQTLKPDIVILDIAMPDLNGIEAARQIREGAPEAKIIALSMHADKRFISGMLGAGACGYLLKDCASEELVAAIQTVAEKGTYLSAKVVSVVVKEFVSRNPLDKASAFSFLTSRQCEVLQSLSEGKNTKQIAFELNLSIKTVETHTHKIMEKLDIHSIADLTKYAIREGITSLDA